MKIAISNIAWSLSENDKIAQILSEFLIGDIEIAPTKTFDNPLLCDDETINAQVSYWHQRNIRMAAMQSLLFGRPELTIFENDSVRIDTLKYLSEIIKLGSKLGIGVFVFGSPKNRRVGGLSKSKTMDIAVKFFSALGEIAHSYNAKFCIEPNSAEYGCDFIRTTGEGIDLVSEVGHPGFRLHIDAGVMTLNGEKYEESLEEAFKYMEHFHVSEPYLHKIGSGKTEHDRIAYCLKSLNYGKLVSIEMRDGLEESNIAVVTDSLQYVIERYRV